MTQLDMQHLLNWTAFLRLCMEKRNLIKGKQVHASLLNSTLEKNLTVWSTLFNMYVECGSVAEAQQVFDLMPSRNPSVWSMMIATYVQNGNAVEALLFFKHMQQEGIQPNGIVLLNVLKICAVISVPVWGKLIHAYIIKGGYGLKLFFGNTIIDMYAKCGSILEACEVFNFLSLPDVVSCNVMIATYARHQLFRDALQFFYLMQEDGLTPDKVTFINIASACTAASMLEHGKLVHANLLKPVCQLDVMLSNALVDMYAKCGSMEDACHLFEQTISPDIVCWTAIITGYSQQRDARTALKLFEQMQREGLRPNRITFTGVLIACTGMLALNKGKLVHAQIMKAIPTMNIFVCSALIDMYSQCGSIDAIKQIFERIPTQDIVSFNAMIAGYANYRDGKNVICIFEHMQMEGLKADKVTFLNLISACTVVQGRGKWVHAVVLESTIVLDISVGSSIIDMYAGCTYLGEACIVFDRLVTRNVVSWTAIISGYVQNGHGSGAITLFFQMKDEGVEPNKITLGCVLNACAVMSALEQGRQLHITFKAKCEVDVVLGSSIVEMYVQSGSMEDAREVFDTLGSRDIMTWSTMISGYGQHGNGKEALNLFTQMQVLDGLAPNEVTFTCILNACSHACLIDEGCHNFSLISLDHGDAPISIHYGCIIDLLGRGGYLDEAENILSSMPFKIYKDACFSLLGASRIYRAAGPAERAIEHISKSQKVNGWTVNSTMQ